MTISDLFCNPKENTKVTVNYSANELKLSHAVIAEDVTALKVDIMFQMTKKGDAGECYISRLIVTNTTTYQSETWTCYSPYSDAGNYAEILGGLAYLLPLMYN